MPSTRTITINFPYPDNLPVDVQHRDEMMQAMNAEVSDFEKHMASLKQDPLVRHEQTLLRTYLAWKLTNESHADNRSND